MQSGGLDREYLLHVPPSYDGADALPLVLNFHGLGGNAQQQMNYTGLPAKSDKEGFLLVAPQGLSTDIIAIPHWNNTQLEPSPNDVGYTRDLIDKLSTELCVDPSRVYATGMSMGGMMSSRLACSLSDRIAAVAPVAGLYFPPLGSDLPESPECKSTRPVPILAFHGDADPIVPFDGGPVGIEDLPIGVTFRDMDGEVLPDWAGHFGCDGAPSDERVTEHVRLISYSGCEAPLSLYVIENGGHTWPDAAQDIVPDQLGETTHEISANDLMWDFFKEQLLEDAASPTNAPAVDLPDAGTSDGSQDGFEGWWAFVIAAVLAGALALGGGLYLRRR
jgi:polyhydroxybutyrate depolymerase